MSSTRLLSCATQSKSVYHFMQCDLLDSHVEVGDVLIISKPNSTDVVGKLIDVSVLNDVCVDEIEIGDGIFFLTTVKITTANFVGYLRFGNQ